MAAEGDASTSYVVDDNQEFRYDSDSEESVNSWASFPTDDPEFTVTRLLDVDSDSGDDSDHEPTRNTVDRGGQRGVASGQTLPQHQTFNNIDWERFDEGESHRSTCLGPFTKRSGLLVDLNEPTPLDFFNLYFPDEVINLLVTETNRYAAQSLAPLPDSNFYKKRWTPVSDVQVCAFIGLQIAMGIDPKTSISDHWQKYWLLGNCFSDVMPYYNYKMLQAFFHFRDNTGRIPRGQVGYMPLYKIQPLLDLTQSTYGTNFYPSQHLSVDESMAPFKGRIHFQQYMPDKPTKRGFKLFTLCDAATFFCLKFCVYTGKNYFNFTGPDTFVDHVVKDLLESYLNFNHVIYMDSYYSSPTLFKALELQKTGAVGTVREDRKGFPPALKKKNLRLKKSDPPKFYRSDNLVCLTWHDTKRCNLLSTVHGNDTVEKRVRAKNTTTGYRSVHKPMIVERYNKYMGGVDHFDQLMINYYYPHRNYKWYLALYHYVKEVALVNAHISYKQHMQRKGNGKVLAVKDFRKELIDQLVKPNVAIRHYKKKSRPNAAHPRLVVSQFYHFPRKYTTKERPRCIVCKHMIRRQTSYYCAPCNAPLCVEPCFRLYHTEDDYQKARAALGNL